MKKRLSNLAILIALKKCLKSRREVFGFLFREDEWYNKKKTPNHENRIDGKEISCRIAMTWKDLSWPFWKGICLKKVKGCCRTFSECFYDIRFPHIINIFISFEPYYFPFIQEEYSKQEPTFSPKFEDVHNQFSFFLSNFSRLKGLPILLNCFYIRYCTHYFHNITFFV